MNISYAQERRLVKGLLEAAGLSPRDADTVSRVVSHSDFTGVYSHGLSRLTRYLRQYEAGALNPAPRYETVLDDQAVLVVDGDNGSGIVTVDRAYEQAREKARQFGVGLVAGRRSANIGCGSYYGWRAVEEDLICILCCGTYAFSAPFGGAERLLGTDPIIVAVPTAEACPLVLDISTTHVAMGKIQAAQREGRPIPSDWAKDSEGRPTTDPAAAYALSFIAGHKGYGLAVMVEALSSLLSGAAFGRDVGLFSKLEKEDTGFFLLLIDPGRFMPIRDFKARADRFAVTIKESRKAQGVEEILLPGELERRRWQELTDSGVAVSQALGEELAALGRRLGLPCEDFPALLRRFDTETENKEDHP